MFAAARIHAMLRPQTFAAKVAEWIWLIVNDKRSNKEDEASRDAEGIQG